MLIGGEYGEEEMVLTGCQTSGSGDDEMPVGRRAAAMRLLVSQMDQVRERITYPVEGKKKAAGQTEGEKED